MNPGKLRWGVFFILTGVLLMLTTSGRLSWEFWVDLVWLWPMLLIAIGVEKICLATKLKPLAYISSVILVGTVFWAYSTYANEPRFESIDDGEFVTDYNKDFPHDSTVSAVNANFDFGAGTLMIGATSDRMFEGEFFSDFGKPRVTLRKRRNEAVLRVRMPNDKYNIRWPGRIDNKWRVKLSDKIPVKLNIDCGAASLKLDLSEIQIEKFNLDCGASDIDVWFGARSPRVDAYINCGASSMKILIPRGAGLRVRRDTPVSSFSSGPIKLRKRGSYQETEGFSRAPVQINLDLEAGVSSFRVTYSDETVKDGAI